MTHTVYSYATLSEGNQTELQIASDILLTILTNQTDQATSLKKSIPVKPQLDDEAKPDETSETTEAAVVMATAPTEPVDPSVLLAIAEHANCCANVLWALSRLCRRAMAKNTSNYSNIDYLTSHGLIDKLVNVINVVGSNVSVALPASFLVMVLASDNQTNQVHQKLLRIKFSPIS